MGGFECERVDMKWLALCTDGSTGSYQSEVACSHTSGKINRLIVNTVRMIVILTVFLCIRNIFAVLFLDGAIYHIVFLIRIMTAQQYRRKERIFTFSFTP